jgi:hypothetical protein
LSVVELPELPGSIEEGASGNGVNWVELSGTGDETVGSVVVLGVVELSTGLVSTDVGTGDETVGSVVVLGVVELSTGLVSKDAGTVPILALSGMPPGQRELRGKWLQRISIPSGDILISVGELIDESLDSENRDLLDSAIATLVVSAKVMTVPIRVRDFPFILKLTSRSTEHFAN